MEKIKIFVDGDCIVCDMEIAHYKRIAPDKFDLVDISDERFDAKKFDLTKEAVMENMHLLTAEGQLLVGVDAFIHIWQQIPRYNLAARLVARQPIKCLAKIGYKLFTKVRPFLPRKRS